MNTTAHDRPLRIGLLATEFLINIGANDFLKNIIRGLARRPNTKLYFICPAPHEKVEHAISPGTKELLKHIPYFREAARAVVRLAGPAASRLAPKPDFAAYAFYAEACLQMEFVVSDSSPGSLIELSRTHALDVLMPSIHVLPPTLPYVTYWPDCQPKRYPEFFNDDAQRVRDERIRALLDSGRPMIINSRDAKNDMAKYYGAPASQVFELPFAPIIEFDRCAPHPELMAPYEVETPYFIVCNQFWVHKSIETVIEAARIVKERRLGARLVFTGRMAEPRIPGYIEGLHKMVSDLDVADVVRFLGYIPKDDQLELIKGAVAVVQPTLFEGGPGGGSIYDAVSLGVRGIVSDIPINHELPLHPDRLVLFRSKDAADLVDKMERMLAQPYRRPSPEDLYQQSKASADLLSRRLYEAIDHALRARPDDSATAPDGNAVAQSAQDSSAARQ